MIENHVAPHFTNYTDTPYWLASCSFAHPIISFTSETLPNARDTQSIPKALTLQIASARFYLHVGKTPTFNATQSQGLCHTLSSSREFLMTTITIKELRH
jgi:hypothetical protein